MGLENLDEDCFGWLAYDSLLFLRINIRWLGSGFLGTHSLGLRKDGAGVGKELKQEWREVGFGLW